MCRIDMKLKTKTIGKEEKGQDIGAKEAAPGRIFYI
jgi:hypothetical protein